MKNNKLNILIAVGLILMAGAARIINHEMHLYNLAPVGALGLFAGAVIKDKRLAILLPLLAQLIGDAYFSLFTSTQGFYAIEQQGFVYIALLAVTGLGMTMGQPKALKVLGYAIAGSMVFFLLSNFGIWISLEIGKPDIYGYGTGWSGLVATYAAAIPFYQHTLAGDLAGAVVLFGAYFLLQQAVASKTQKAHI